MSRRSMFLALLLLPGIMAGEAEAQVEVRRSRGFDVTPPRVSLTAPETAGLTFPVSVRARDENGIAKVFIAIDGDIAAGRIDAPFEFTLTVPHLPAEICALAEDPSGNSSRDCKTVRPPAPPACLENSACDEDEFCMKRPGECQGVGECTPRPGSCREVLDPVCGCDGQTYPNACFAGAAGVNVARPGRCDGEVAVLLLNVDPAELTSCTDQLQLTAQARNAGGLPVPGVVIVFEQAPPSDVTGSFSPPQALSDGQGQASSIWTPHTPSCLSECVAALADPSSPTPGICELFLRARTGTVESLPVQVIDSIP